ncbi:MAG TPA: dihydrofolate reductase family protein [Gemmatimonadaceae bacterium]|nr:dihydrofolate reductase family protein [Gemmatimonadaceae bacterium]
MAATRQRTKRGKGDRGRVHLYVGISLDGYVAGPDHDLTFLEPYQDARAGFVPFSKTIGSTIMGRTTYDVAVAGGFGGDFGMPAYVMTTRPIPSRTDVIPSSGDLAALVDSIREQHPRDIWLMGGGKVAMAFAAENLIDIWTVAFVPAVLGAGIPMFPSGAFREQRLRLVKTHSYKSGVVELRYERSTP